MGAGAVGGRSRRQCVSPFHGRSRRAGPLKPSLGARSRAIPGARGPAPTSRPRNGAHHCLYSLVECRRDAMALLARRLVRAGSPATCWSKPRRWLASSGRASLRRACATGMSRTEPQGWMSCVPTQRRSAARTPSAQHCNRNRGQARSHSKRKAARITRPAVDRCRVGRDGTRRLPRARSHRR